MGPGSTTYWRPNETSLTRDSFNAFVRHQKCDVSMVLQRDAKMSRNLILANPPVQFRSTSVLQPLPPSPRGIAGGPLRRSASSGGLVGPRSPEAGSSPKSGGACSSEGVRRSLSLCSSKLDGPGSIRLGTPTAAEAAAERAALAREQFQGLARPAAVRWQEPTSQPPSPTSAASERPRLSRGGSFLPPEAGRLQRPKQLHSLSVVASLSPEFSDMVQGVFAKMDENGDGSITKAEAKAFFRKFSGISADAMFQAVDEDQDDTITLDEFLAFWMSVKRNGYNEEDLRDELGELLEGNAWVSFEAEQRENYGSGAPSPSGRNCVSRK